MSNAIASRDDELAEILGHIRAARFQAGICCPRCLRGPIHRWGSFSGRQRYRCTACRRCFSDLTGTPAAYAKKLHLWQRHAGLLAQGLTLRRVAAALGIHLSTAFYWRHLVLAERCNRDVAKLTGSIELSDLWFAYSEKGRRDLGRPARRRGVASRTRYRGATVRVLLACDRNGGSVTSLVLAKRVRFRDLRDALEARIEGRPVIFARTGPLSPPGRFAKVMRGTYCGADRRRGSPLIPNVAGYAVRLKAWLSRFRGVATHYMPNYLIWHRLVERTPPLAFRLAMSSWPVAVGLG